MSSKELGDLFFSAVYDSQFAILSPFLEVFSVYNLGRQKLISFEPFQGVRRCEKVTVGAHFPRFNMNILTLDFPDMKFDGIICVYTLWHIPRKNHPAIIQNFHRMLKDGGILVLNTGIYESEGVSEFFGEPMLWSTNDPKKTLAAVKDLGFEVIHEGVLKLGGERQYWIIARKVLGQRPISLYS